MIIIAKPQAMTMATAAACDFKARRSRINLRSSSDITNPRKLYHASVLAAARVRLCFSPVI